jgi:hypothetical protein
LIKLLILMKFPGNNDFYLHLDIFGIKMYVIKELFILIF